jgi:hypothetical protein
MMYYGPYSDNLSTFTLLKQIAQIPQNLLLARVSNLDVSACFSGATWIGDQGFSYDVLWAL